MSPNYLHADPKRKLTDKHLEAFMYSDAERWVKMLFIYLYYYGVRISEALAVEVEDFVVLEHEGDTYLSVTSKTLKNPSQKSRVLWVPREAPFIEEFLLYLKLVDSGRVWTFTRAWAWNRLQKTLPWVTPHGFRHNRLDDFAQGGESAYALKSWAGWSDIRPGDSYVQSVDTRKMARRHFKK